MAGVNAIEREVHSGRMPGFLNWAGAIGAFYMREYFDVTRLRYFREVFFEFKGRDEKRRVLTEELSDDLLGRFGRWQWGLSRPESVMRALAQVDYMLGVANEDRDF